MFKFFKRVFGAIPKAVKAVWEFHEKYKAIIDIVMSVIKTLEEINDLVNEEKHIVAFQQILEEAQGYGMKIKDKDIGSLIKLAIVVQEILGR